MAESNSEVQQRGGIIGYLKGVEAELKKVVWPTKRELINYTLAVFIMSVFIAVLVYIVDAIFAQLFNTLMHFVG
ncbi:MAG: preprotein translocase subunit SecE [Veillonella sp.]|nr:preprotein translocase subunit SecE [Veillonella sp.]MCF0155626.1 preprotein translocase subunit SecE [Veillonella sp.]